MRYYEPLAKGMRREQVIWSEPYLDSSGIGIVTTAAKAIYEEETGEFIGVVGTDVPLAPSSLYGTLSMRALEEHFPGRISCELFKYDIVNICMSTKVCVNIW